ncbi:cytochrome P450 [Umbelopsis sp. AD052]|nr:cytochrome P450 [Umbelopsis sp. AD052]
MESYINREKVNETIQNLLHTISHLSKAEIVGYTATALTAHYIITTFVLDKLSNIPGPFAAKLTRFYDVKMKASGKRYVLIDELHKKYGKIVRTGYDTVSIHDAEAVKQIYGGDKFRKAPYYRVFLFNNTSSLIETSDPVQHARYRRIFAAGFSQATLDSLEDLIMESGIIALMDKLSAKYADKHVVCNIFNELHLMAFDILGELAYGKSFNMIQRESHPFPTWIKTRSTMMPLCTTFPEINHYPKLLSIFFPKSSGATNDILEFSKKSLSARIADKANQRRDFTQLMVEAMEADKDGNYLTASESQVASVVLLVAGTDTTSNTMTFVAFLLSKYPHVQERLFQVLKEAMPKKNATINYKHAKKEKLPYLWAVLMEVTRLYPAVPGGLPRVTPKGGAVIARQFIPEGTVVEVPTWSLHHDPALFANPFEFKPERWLGDDAEELSKNHLVFSVGPRMCAGKNLAMMEMTLAMAHFYRRFTVSLADPNETMPMIQQFIMKPASLQLNVYLRSRDH